MTLASAMHQAAAREASSLPPLLARAEHLAGTVLLGEHGRRRAGAGDDFWQYRPAQAGDSLRMIDHRRSARGDTQFVRDREWQVAQSVLLWVDRGASMRFASNPKHLPEKAERARLLTLAIAILLVRGGERVGLPDSRLPPRRGRTQVHRLADLFSKDDADDHVPPDHSFMFPHARALFVSDFLGPMDDIALALSRAADQRIRGVLYQVLDPQEEAFPYRGRAVFRSVGGSMIHRTLKANALRGRYLEKLAARKAELRDLCTTTGWQFGLHHTSDSAQAGLLWLYRALENGET